MTLPSRPERSEPIPNNPFEHESKLTVQGPYWHMAIGGGLESDPQGSIQTEGSLPSNPSAYIYGSNGFLGLGTNLVITDEGEVAVD